MSMDDRSVGYDAQEPPEAGAKLYCDRCGEPIYEGERYYYLWPENKILCESCMGDFAEIA